MQRDALDISFILALKDPMAEMIFGSFFLIIVTIAIVYALHFWWRSGSVRRRLNQFFGRGYRDRPVVKRSISVIDLPNIRRGVEAFAQSNSAQLETLTTHGGGLQSEGLAFAAPRLQQSEINEEVTEDCLANPLYLVSTDRERWAIHAHGIDSYGSCPVLEVMALSQEKSGQCLRDIRHLMKVHSVYRGKVISIETSTGGVGLTESDPGNAGPHRVQFHRLPPVSGDAIVLPEDVMNTIQRNTIRFFRNVKRLTQYGFSSKRGLLFHGPPGTGKTRTACWLAHSLPRVTVILVSGEQLWNIKMCCDLARDLSPAMLILEDVDLIATRRDESVQTTALHQLMNEMDGMDSDSDVLFLLTTNQPEQIEPALANRPGRIDQAIHFPMPDEDCRRRLIELYRNGMEIAIDDWPKLLDTTSGSSPAFIKELVRKAAMIVIEELQESSSPAVIRDRHFEASLKEMTQGKGNRTRRITGFSAEDG